MKNKTITLSAGIEEYLDLSHSEIVILKDIGYNQIDVNGSKQRRLSFAIILGEHSDWQMMEEGAEFEFQNSRWKAQSINTKENGKAAEGSRNSVTFQCIS
ncbi:MAG: hypothetical protein MK207_04030 [Saprospiraceae bacterium]|nr:hypothetical protein [Saprospiraceae bacterium]